MKLYFYFLSNRSKEIPEISCEECDVVSDGEKYRPVVKFPKLFDYKDYISKSAIDTIKFAGFDTLCIILEKSNIARAALAFKADCDNVIRRANCIIEDAKTDIARSEEVFEYIKQWEEQHGKTE